MLRRELASLVLRDTISQTGQGRGIKLVTENSTPVGSGRFRDHAQDSYRFLGMSFSSSLARRETGCVSHVRGTRSVGTRASCLAESATKQARKAALPTRESSSLLLMHSPVLLAEERMSQVASTALEREIHFCPGLAVEPVSHRRKDRNSCDFSFRFHECWSSGAAASDGSNSVSIFGAGWTRTKYSRPISSCRIGSGNISASRAYCERCAAIAAIFCWT